MWTVYISLNQNKNKSIKKDKHRIEIESFKWEDNKRNFASQTLKKKQIKLSFS